MKHLEQKIINRVEEKLRRLNKIRPLPPSVVKKLQEQFRIEMTYNSNGIEGNSLTLKETFLVINEGITIKGKPLRDHLEAKDHYVALEYLSDLVEKGKSQTISEQLIRNLHQIVIQDTEREWAGKYRNSNVIIGGAKHKPPDALNVPYEMAKLIKWWKTNQNKLHAIELAARLHHQLVYVHPFFDGNGRVARTVMNLILLQTGYPLTIILKNDRKKYYRALSQADENKPVPFIRFIAQAVERSLNICLKTLTPVSKEREKFITLKQASRIFPYSAKYLNLLVRQGKLEAHKEERNWLTSKRAIEEYIENRERKRKIKGGQN
jgi:Fic family protein